MNKTKLYSNNIINVFSYFLILLPLFLVSGPFLSDLAISTLAILSLFVLKDKKFINNYFFIFFMIFWALIILSSSFSENKILSFKNSIFYFRFCLFSLFVWWILENNIKILEKIYFFLLVCFFGIIFDSFFQYFNGVNILNMKIVTQNRISSFFGSELKMGSFLMRFFPFLIALSFFFYKKKKHKKFLIPAIVFIILVQLTIFLSGERTGFILFNFTIILFLIFLNDFKNIRIFLLLIYSISIILIFTIDTPFKKRIINLTAKQTQINQLEKKKYIFSKQYHEHYLSSWKMFNDNILVGIGPKNFRVKCKDEKYNLSKLTCSTHPHNFPLQLLAETGIFCFLIYLIINIFVWYNLIKSLFVKILYKKKFLNNFQISLLINIAILIWPLAPNGNFFNNWVSITVYYPVGFLLWELSNSKKIQIKPFKK
jgi:O-antigen ligase